MTLPRKTSATNQARNSALQAAFLTVPRFGGAFAAAQLRSEIDQDAALNAKG